MVESEDTAKSAIDIAASGLKGVGAVASELAASQNGLEILARSIETYKQNFTRFLILDDAITVPRSEINKASLSQRPEGRLCRRSQQLCEEAVYPRRA